MGRWLGAGRPWLKIDVVDPERGSRPGVRIVEAHDMSDREKAPEDGVYLLERGRYRVRKGELMPPGAVFANADDEAAAAKQAKAARRSPRRVAGDPGPSENTQGAGPSETTETDPAKMKRADLNAYAVAHGIADPDGYPNIESLLAALQPPPAPPTPQGDTGTQSDQTGQ